MKLQEAIDRLQSRYMTMSMGFVGKDGFNECKAQNEAINMAIVALEKQIPQKPMYHHEEYGKHTWQLNGYGEIDICAYDTDFHNGPRCTVCGKCYCHHCDPDCYEREDCEKKWWTCPRCSETVYLNNNCKCGQIIDWGAKV